MQLVKRAPAIIGLAVIVCGIADASRQQAITAKDAGARVDWTQSYDAGYTDANGAYAGGAEIMHLIPHQGKLYAANGYWMDSRWEKPPYAEKQSAQVLRLDSADGRWEVDLDMGKSNGHGLRYMKGNILKSVTFTRDEFGKLLPRPQSLLVMAAGAYTQKHGVVSAWVCDDAAGTWNHGIVKRGSRAGGTRWVPRDMEVYRDKVTGVERLFLLIGNPGIISGVYDASQPTKIRWDEKVEFPARGTFSTRPLGIVEANGSLLFSVGGVIYRRIDGPSPTYTEVLNLGDGVNTDVGGIRGLTTINNPNGAGESMLFLWAPNGRSIGQIKRLDPDGSRGYTAHDEANMSHLMSKKLGVEVGFTLGAHSNMYPVVHPVTGEAVHIIGFQGKLQGSDHLRWRGSRLYAGAMYAIRTVDQTYTVHEVNGAYAPGKPVLVSPRTFALSPFGDNLLFVGGHDASGNRSDDMAWIFKASLDVVLGLSGKGDITDIDTGRRTEYAPGMPRTARSIEAGTVYHVLNRGNGRMRLFHKDGDYEAFERVLTEGFSRYPVDLLTYCLMPNHWHLVVRPKTDEALGRMMGWVGVTHVRRHHEHYHQRGTGHLYQGRFKSFPVAEDDYFLTLCRYVEANPLRAKLVERAGQWPFSGLWCREHGETEIPLSPWPVPRPRNWKALVHADLAEDQLQGVRECVVRGRPLGTAAWVRSTAKRLGLEFTLRGPGRPRKTENNQ